MTPVSLVTACCLFLLIAPGEGQVYESLYNNLMTRYKDQNSKFSIPTTSVNQIVKVNVSVNLIDVVSVDTDTGVAELEMWFSLMWRDGRLQWDPSNFNNISTLHVPHDQIWRPDIWPYRGSAKVVQEEYNAVVNSNGEVIIAQQVNYRSRCVLYPSKDTVGCYVEMGSWTYNGNQLSPELLENSISLTEFRVGLWNVQDSHAKRNVVIYTCCPEPYPILLYTLILKRRSA